MTKKKQKKVNFMDWWMNKELIKVTKGMGKAIYPKNIWLEEYLGDERTWDDFSGITEIVELNDLEVKRVTKAFYAVKAIQDKYAV